MFNRLAKLFKGFLSLFIKGIEVSNPEALIEAEKESLREKVASFNKNLAKQAGFISRLDNQIVELTKKDMEISSKTAAYLKAGNTKIAGEFALQLKDIKTQLGENKTQRQEAEEVYKSLLKTRDVTVREARNKIESLAQKLSQVKMKEAEADLREMATAMVSGIGTDGDTLNRLDEQLNERLQEATGKARVAKDSMDSTEIELKESEREALGQQALAEFAVSQGIEMPGIETLKSAPTVQKTMGPEEVKASEQVKE